MSFSTPSTKLCTQGAYTACPKSWLELRHGRRHFSISVCTICGTKNISPTSGKLNLSFVVDPESASACEAASPATPGCEGSCVGGAAAEAKAPFVPLGDAEVDDGAAAFAGGSEAVGEAEAEAEAEAVSEAEADDKPQAEAEAEAEAVVGAV